MVNSRATLSRKLGGRRGGLICRLAMLLLLVGTTGCQGGAVASSTSPQATTKTATPSSPTPSQSPTPNASWQLYVNDTFGLSIEYPPGFVVQSVVNPDGGLPPGRLVEMRAVDVAFEGEYPPGEVDFGIYVRDSDSLTGWVQKHTGPCASSLSSMYYWDSTSNLVSTSVSGRSIVSFDWVHPCGATFPLHEAVTFLGTSYVLRINAWYSNPDYAATAEQYASAMLASVKQ